MRSRDRLYLSPISFSVSSSSSSRPKRQRMMRDSIGVWDRRKGGKPRVTLEQKWFTYAVATHPELVVIGNVLELELYTPALKRVGKIKLPDGLYSVAISRDAKTICAGTYGKLLVWKRK